MGVVEADDGDVELFADLDHFPCEVVRVAAFDDVGFFLLDVFGGFLEIEEDAVAGGLVDVRGFDGCDGAVVFANDFGFGGWDDEEVLVLGELLEVAFFFCDVTSNTAAEGGEELGDVADFHNESLLVTQKFHLVTSF